MIRRQEGSSLIEAVLVGLLLLVPMIWMLTILAELHRGALALTSAARDAGQDAARANDEASAIEAIDAAVTAALIDHGLDPKKVGVRWEVPPGLERGAPIEVELEYPVAVLQAPFLGSVSKPAINVSATHVARIDPYRSRE